MALVTLQAMDDVAFKRFLEATRTAYSQERSVSDHLTLEAATEFASSQLVELLPQGRLTANHFFQNVVATTSNQTVGGIWYFFNHRSGEAFIYEIQIDPDQRRQGYARATLDLVADHARAAGCRILSLNVFAPNTGARSLYQQAGFAEQSLYMNRRL